MHLQVGYEAVSIRREIVHQKRIRIIDILASLGKEDI
jgi:hypothetical protein